eukprot:3222389-Rhodomonas_salina.1
MGSSAGVSARNEAQEKLTRLLVRWRCCGRRFLRSRRCSGSPARSFCPRLTTRSLSDPPPRSLPHPPASAILAQRWGA